MHRGGGFTGWARPALGRALLLLLPVVLAGCGARAGALARPAPESLPPGSPLRDRQLADSDAWLRHHVMFGEFDRALGVLDGRRGVPDDALWRALQRALILHHAGEYARSNEVFEWAEAEADLRYTRSISRGVGSLVLNDRALAYTPSAAELAMIPYYRMLNYVGLRDHGSAAVEARKANALLTRTDRRAVARCREDGMVGYIAGLVLQATGDSNDALVSLRRAEQDFLSCGPDAGLSFPVTMGTDLVRTARSLGVGEVADSAAARYGVDEPPPDAAELLLLVEHGFIAHRVEQALHVPIFPADLEGVDGEETDWMAAAARISARVAVNLVERSVWGTAWDDHPLTQLGNALDGAYVLRLAWPGLGRPGAAANVRVWLNDSLAVVTPVSDLSTLSADELQAERLLVLTRMIARGIAKYRTSRVIERTAEEQVGEVAGFLAGRLSNLVANDLERADTRSWSLLPDQVSMVRAHLPPGEHRVRLEILGLDGAVMGERDLGVLQVRAGDLVLRNERVWAAAVSP